LLPEPATEPNLISDGISKRNLDSISPSQAQKKAVSKFNFWLNDLEVTCEWNGLAAFIWSSFFPLAKALHFVRQHSKATYLNNISKLLTLFGVVDIASESEIEYPRAKVNDLKYYSDSIYNFQLWVYIPVCV
jgi:hypothetical protein